MIRQHYTHHHVHKCAFARAVMADQSQKLAAVEPEIDRFQRLDRPEGFADPAQRKKGSRSGFPSLKAICGHTVLKNPIEESSPAAGRCRSFRRR